MKYKNQNVYTIFVQPNKCTVDSRSFEPSREIEKSSSYREFELSRVKLYRKRSEGKCKLLRVSGRFEL